MIASTGFTSGDRFVIGHWKRSDLGAFTDVMWAPPGGTRTLLAPSETVAAFVTTLYDFARVEIVDVRAVMDGRSLAVDAGGVRIRLEAGRGLWMLPRRPRWITRHIEAPIAERVMGVTTYGVAGGGVEEWYQAHRWQPLVAADGYVEGRRLGEMAPLRTPGGDRLGFGFSEPPARPSLVSLTTILFDRRGVLGRRT